MSACKLFYHVNSFYSMEICEDYSSTGLQMFKNTYVFIPKQMQFRSYKSIMITQDINSDLITFLARVMHIINI